MKKKKMIFDSGQLPKYLIYAFFVWFILSCLVIPNINTIFTVFFENGEFTLEPLQKLLSSEKAMKSLRNSCILAPTLSVTVGFVGISLVLITEYFDSGSENVTHWLYDNTDLWWNHSCVRIQIYLRKQWISYKYFCKGNSKFPNRLVSGVLGSFVCHDVCMHIKSYDFFEECNACS